MHRLNIAAALATAVLCFGAVAPAVAADLGGPRGRSSASPYFDGGPAYGLSRWSGLYIGATLGYNTGTTGVSGDSGGFSFDSDGTVGTVFAGYNWQIGSTVAGIEADIGGGGNDGSRSGISSELNVLGSLRGRFGVLMTPQTLLYATGGLAWGDYDFKMQGANVASQTYIGYQLGAGLEFAIAPQWTLRAEYLFTDLGSERLDHGGVSNSYDLDSHAIRAGLAVKF